MIMIIFHLEIMNMTTITMTPCLVCGCVYAGVFVCVYVRIHVIVLVSLFVPIRACVNRESALKSHNTRVHSSFPISVPYTTTCLKHQPVFSVQGQPIDVMDHSCL